MMTLLLLLALVLLLVYAGWLWTAPGGPGVREAGLVELLLPSPRACWWVACWQSGAGGCGEHGPLSGCTVAPAAF